MTAMTPAIHDAGQRDRRGPLAGLNALARKDTTEWLRGRRAIVVFIIVTAFMALAAANGAITQWIIANVPDASTGAKAAPIDPLSNLVTGASSQIFALAAILATMGLIATERDSGTLAWTAAKPVSRAAIPVSKWITSSVVLMVTAVALPLILTAIEVTVLYSANGSLPIEVVAGLGVGMAASLAFIVAVVITASTFLRSQAAVAAIGIGVLALPGIVSSIVPIGDYLPTSILDWTIGVVSGQPVSWATPVAWVVSITLLLGVAARRVDRMEF